jgi:hypothetical protein
LNNLWELEPGESLKGPQIREDGFEVNSTEGKQGDTKSTTQYQREDSHGEYFAPFDVEIKINVLPFIPKHISSI